jgi:hypothetical protein
MRRRRRRRRRVTAGGCGMAWMMRRESVLRNVIARDEDDAARRHACIRKRCRSRGGRLRRRSGGIADRGLGRLERDVAAGHLSREEEEREGADGSSVDAVTASRGRKIGDERLKEQLARALKGAGKATRTTRRLGWPLGNQQSAALGCHFANGEAGMPRSRGWRATGTTATRPRDD